MRSSLTRALIVAILAASGCGGADVVQAFPPERPDAPAPRPPESPPDPLPGTFTLVINGTHWVAAENVHATWKDGLLELVTTAPFGPEPMSVVLRLIGAEKPGTYRLTSDGDGSLVVALNERVTRREDFTWSTNSGYGTVTITTLTADRVVGTLTGYLSPPGESYESLFITGGRFHITF